MGEWARLRLGALLLVLAGLLAYVLAPPRPCRRVLTYRVGAVDPRFGITREAFGAALAEAARLWGAAAGRPLFREAAKGALEVRLVYDHRQETVDRLRAGGLRLDGTRAACEALRARFEALCAEHGSGQEALRRDEEALDRRVWAFNAAVRARPGDGEHRRLAAEEAELRAARERLDRLRAELNALAEQANAIVGPLNELAAAHNLDRVALREAGERLGPEYWKGQYTQEGRTRRIEVFQVDDVQDLTRVLAHELGHALGLEHVADPEAVMARHARPGAAALRMIDRQALRARCEGR